MVFTLVVLKLFCIAYCVASTLSDAREEAAPAPRIPNPDRVLNSVLGRLERSRQERMEDPDDADCCQHSEILPEYTESLHNRERGLRQLESQKHYPICHLERKIRRLNTDEYEYRPAYYEEVMCVPNRDEIITSSEICSSLGFSCVQWNKTLHLTRRRFDSDCWETKTMVIPAGCECMWPVRQLGDMKYHV